MTALTAATLLISGSRDATPAMLDYATRAVLRCEELGWSIVVGDADGIDKAVINQAYWSRVPVRSYGVTAKPQVSNNFLWENPEWNSADSYSYTQCAVNYLTRDRYMAELCDRALCIWNGRSRGTLYTHKAVLALGKHSDLINFHKEPTK